jgi:hypothetical protein
VIPLKITIPAADVEAFGRVMQDMFERVGHDLARFTDAMTRAAPKWRTLADGLALGSMKAAGHLGPDVMAACADRAWQMQNTVPLGLVDVETGVPWVVLAARRPSDPRQAAITVQDQEPTR